MARVSIRLSPFGGRGVRGETEWWRDEMREKSTELFSGRSPYEGFLWKNWGKPCRAKEVFTLSSHCLTNDLTVLLHSKKVIIINLKAS